MIKRCCTRRYYRIIHILFLLLIIETALRACNSGEMLDYYEKREHYITAVGTTTHVVFDESTNTLYLNFSNIEPKLDDNCLKLVGKNVGIIQDKLNSLTDLNGKRISFATAPRYFGDGYVMPIVALSIDEEEYLVFEDGFCNFLEWLKAN